MDMSAEADLLRRAQAGDNEASDALYREYFESNRQIHNLLLREVAAPEAREDILHDAFLSLVRSKSEFRGDSRLQTFVYRVVQIAILQKLRSDKARRSSKMVRLFVELSGESVERELAVTDYGYEKVESEQMAERMYTLLPEPLRTALLVVSIVPITVFANFLRVVALVLMTYYFGADAVEGLFHDFTGILLFVVAIVLFFAVDGVIVALGALMRWRPARRPSTAR